MCISRGIYGERLACGRVTRSRRWSRRAETPRGELKSQRIGHPTRQRRKPSPRGPSESYHATFTNPFLQIHPRATVCHHMPAGLESRSGGSRGCVGLVARSRHTSLANPAHNRRPRPAHTSNRAQLTLWSSLKIMLLKSAESASASHVWGWRVMRRTHIGGRRTLRPPPPPRPDIVGFLG